MRARNAYPTRTDPSINRYRAISKIGCDLKRLDLMNKDGCFFNGWDIHLSLHNNANRGLQLDYLTVDTGTLDEPFSGGLSMCVCGGGNKLNE